MSITIKEMAATVAISAGTTKVAAEKIIEDLFELLGDSLKEGETIVVKNFGRFYTHTRAARKGRNPKTGEAINIPSKTVIKFAPRGDMK